MPILFWRYQIKLNLFNQVLILNKITYKIALNPKKIFLIDGLGAILSAFLLVAIAIYESLFGMPAETLYILAVIPCVFAIYDFNCYNQIKKNHQFFLKIIIWANLTYCFVSIGLLMYHYKKITALGWTYFFLEIVIISILVYVEMKIMHHLSRKN